MGSESQTVVVTGASGGVGRATAVEFARHGARVALLARGHEGLEGAAREVTASGGTALAIPVDVADHGQVEAAAGQVEQTFGPIDIWVNAAMATVFCPIDETDPDDFRRATEVTYLGTVHGSLAALRRMRVRNRGTLVQVGSALSYRGIPLQAAYCGAKFAIRGFTDSLQAELLHEQSAVKVTMVHLAAFNTPQFDWARNCFDRKPQPLPPIFQPEVAARGIVWAAFHPRRDYWVGGPAVKSILAARWLPAGWLDRYTARNAWQGQLTDEPVTVPKQDNLYRPLAGDFGSHGRFDDRAKPRSRQLQLNRNRRSIAFAIGLVSLLAIVGGIRAARRHHARG